MRRREKRLSAGFGDPVVLIMLGILVWLGYLAVTTPDKPQSPPPPAPAPGAGIAYAPFVFVDGDTGCQYLSTHMSAGLVPRIAADGRTHIGCKGAH